MVRMIPADYGSSYSMGEKRVVNAFNGARSSNHWKALHRLTLAQNEVACGCERDLVVMVLSAGNVVIESKVRQGG